MLNNEDRLTFGKTKIKQKHTVSLRKIVRLLAKTENGKTIFNGKDEVILPCEEATLVGRHNYMNILAATALAQTIGINLDSTRTALVISKGLDHRFQLVHQANGIRWINDSKATNVGGVQLLHWLGFIY